ncbi:unnamed protein product [Moneuplotes crassus]|uniref:Dynein light chain n=1 Tax=Euplotes crassus TaxID=5936 RepID=A0AAD2D8L3_EUPCR|nr:unnamed protein product [Moneuplotes crassus]
MAHLVEEAVIKHADMAEEMQQHAVDCAAYAFKEKRYLKDVASIIKNEFDVMYNPTWHCIVGRSFGSEVTHTLKHFVYFYWGEVGVLLFKTG